MKNEIVKNKQGRIILKVDPEISLASIRYREKKYGVQLNYCGFDKENDRLILWDGPNNSAIDRSEKYSDFFSAEERKFERKLQSKWAKALNRKFGYNSRDGFKFQGNRKSYPKVALRHAFGPGTFNPVYCVKLP